jgi:hypothetical protein
MMLRLVTALSSSVVSVILLLPVAFAGSERHFSGIVTDSHGIPLDGVNVAVQSTSTETAKDGFYEFDGYGEFIYFTKLGYRPVLKPVLEFNKGVSVQLEDGFLTEWFLPPCTDPRKNFKRKIGAHLRLLTPIGSTLGKGCDFDYCSFYIAPSNERNSPYLSGMIQFGMVGSPNLGSGLPSDDLIRQSTQLHVRSWTFLPGQGIDVRGRYYTGGQWRFVGTQFEFWKYNNAPVEDAKVFNQMIDSLCFERSQRPIEFVERLAVDRKGDKYGFVDEDDQLVIPYQFDEARDFSEGLAAVRIGDKFGYIDKTGEYVIKPNLTEAYDFRDGVARISIDNRWGCIDRTGRILVKPVFDSIMNFSEGLAAAEVKGKWGYINKSGEFVIPPKFEYGMEFHEGKASVKIEGDKFRTINTKGQFIK